MPIVAVAVGRAARLLRSRRNGGCTFAIDPNLDCARAVPLWTGAMDPFVLDVRVEVGGCPLDLSRLGYRVVRAFGRIHLLLELPAGTLQLDLQDTEDQREIVAVRACPERC